MSSPIKTLSGKMSGSQQRALRRMGRAHSDYDRKPGAVLSFSGTKTSYVVASDGSFRRLDRYRKAA
jgi:hypothetical protein